MELLSQEQTVNEDDILVTNLFDLNFLNTKYMVKCKNRTCIYNRMISLKIYHKPSFVFLDASASLGLVVSETGYLVQFQ